MFLRKPASIQASPDGNPEPAWKNPAKEELRAAMAKSCASLNRGEFLREGKEASIRLRAHRLWRDHSTLLIFLSTKREIDTLPLIRGALAEGKRLFAPRVEGEDLVFYRLSRAGGLPKGKFGIREPEADRALTAEDFPVLAITPGMAFDRQGGRLGRGRGYYDRFFSALDAGILPGGKAGSGGLPFTACGFCMKIQLVKKVPVESRDRRMDAVLTENALLPGPLREK